MTDQTQRLEIATVNAEIGSDIIKRFSNDEVAAEPIPTDSGDIQNLKQIIVEIENKASIATSIYPDVTAGLAATAEGSMFLVASNEDAEIYVVYKKETGVAVDTGKRALSAQVVADAAESAADSAQIAEDAAVLASTASSVISLSTGVYPATTAGLAATAVNGYFSVPSIDASEYLILYQNLAGVAAEKKRYPAKAAVDAIAAKLKSSSQALPSRVPIACTESGQVAIWLEDGDFGARDLSPKLRAKAVRDVITTFNGTPTYFPLMKTSQGQVPLWWQLDGFNVASVSKSLTKKILSQDTRVIPPITSSPTSAAPVFTDGRNNHNWRAAAARVQAVVPDAKAKIGVVGDSWAQNPQISRAIRTWLTRMGAMSGEETWRPAITTETYFASSLTYSGWTLVDGSATTVFPYGAGVDGHNIYCPNTAGTLTLSSATATRIRIYYSKVPGAWRYRVDGGSWVEVVSNGGAQELGVVDITGLANTAHSLEIDTTNNTGVAAIHGFSLTNTVGGYEVVKMGNGGVTGQMMKGYIPYMQPVAADFPINLLLVILGTNDYRIAASTPAEYIDALTKLTAAWRAVNPAIGIVFIIPPQSDGVAVVPLSSYRDAMYAFALANNCEFLNMYDVFGSYAQSAALGQWADSLHLNDAGATNLATQLAKAFL